MAQRDGFNLLKYFFYKQNFDKQYQANLTLNEESGFGLMKE